ncbi:unnamed protein product [Rotaria sp. Silwood2]|nr:unnamed protein product [Rotaria sp. Silwood2]
MHIIIHIILIFALLIIAVQSQGGGGGGEGGGGGGRSGSSQNYINPCLTIECEIAVFVSKIVDVLLAAAAIIWAIRTRIRQCTGGRPPVDNTVFINQNSLKNVNFQNNPFMDGIWSSRYYQYNKWHTSHQLSLLFNRYSYQVSGGGTDEIGSYIIDGIFCMRTFRMCLAKVYLVGT